MSVVHRIIHAFAPQLEIEGGKNKMFKTYLDDFSEGCCINVITITSENKANSREKKVNSLVFGEFILSLMCQEPLYSSSEIRLPALSQLSISPWTAVSKLLLNDCRFVASVGNASLSGTVMCVDKCTLILDYSS